jgi:hypothetical protein
MEHTLKSVLDFVSIHCGVLSVCFYTIYIDIETVGGTLVLPFR